MINNGQSCIAAKRFIIHERIYEKFIIKLKEQVDELIIGDPNSSKTQIGPLANEDILAELHKQIQESEEIIINKNKNKKIIITRN